MARLTDDEYKAIAKRAYAAFLRYPNVHSVGVGGRERQGKPTGEIVILVLVDKKVSPSALGPDEMIPAEFEGVPTDVVVAGRPASQQLARIPGFPTSETDTTPGDVDKYRPAKGGTQLQASFRYGNGTLGFLATVTGTTHVVAVTNYHVLFASTGATPSPSVTAGNPDPDESCTKCCVNRLGAYIVGGYDSTVDIALVQLDPGIQWLAEIEGIGNVRGTYNPTVADTLTHTYNVRKRGRTTLLTGGILRGVGMNASETNLNIGARTSSNNIAVAPNPRSDGAAVRFTAPGDSGSAYVNDANQIIGVHFVGSQNATDIGWGYATVIGDILTWLASHGTTIVPATATALNQVQTVQAASARQLAELSATGEAAALAARLEAELSTSELGRLMTVLWMRHSTELNRLVNGNRKVGALWIRNTGPALFQHALRAAKLPDHSIPEAINGKPVADSLAAILDTFERYGSDGLRADIAQHRARIPSIGGRTYADLLASLQEA